MAKILLDYAVAFNQVQGTTAASTAFLEQLGCVCKPSVLSLTATVPGGTDSIPAVMTVAGNFLAGAIVTVTLDSLDGGVINEIIVLNITANSTAEEVAVQLAANINLTAVDWLATANGGTVELLAVAPATEVSIGGPNVIASPAIVLPSIVEITDPAELPFYTDNFIEIQGAFDGGLSKVYLILLNDISELNATIAEKECTFFTIYGTSDFTDVEYSQQFVSWQGVKGWSSTNQTNGKLWAADQDTCIFYEDTAIPAEVSAYYGFFSFGNLLSASQWRNQQYISVASAATGNPIESLGLATSLFDDRLSFYIKDDEQGTRLGFFVCGRRSITTPYINRQLQVDIQSDMAAFISLNEPFNVEASRLLLEQVGDKRIDKYVDDGLLDPAGTNDLTITKGTEEFIVKGDMETSEAVALWRVAIDALNSTGA